jgi:hypothetical protein
MPVPGMPTVAPRVPIDVLTPDLLTFSRTPGRILIERRNRKPIAHLRRYRWCPSGTGSARETPCARARLAIFWPKGIFGWTTVLPRRKSIWESPRLSGSPAPRGSRGHLPEDRSPCRPRGTGAGGDPTQGPAATASALARDGHGMATTSPGYRLHRPSLSTGPRSRLRCCW